MTDETAIELITIQVEHNEKMLKLDNIGVHLDFLGIDLMNAVLDSFGFPKETIRDFEANNFKDEDDELIEIYCRDWLTEPIYKMKSTDEIPVYVKWLRSGADDQWEDYLEANR